jgi:multicomponent Na+:H+ antiporter subunit B
MGGMSKIVKTITSIILPFSTIFGLYIIAHGHLTPGGGFQGGAILASAFAMMLIAFGSNWIIFRDKKPDPNESINDFEAKIENKLSILESLGALGFIILALFGITFSAIFFKNFLVGNEYIFGVIPDFGSRIANINSAGVLPLMNFAVGLKVVAGLFAIVLIMAYSSRFLKERKVK